jgi:predicted ribosome quality control (RQC) complex YloA/Tae2 family protein
MGFNLGGIFKSLVNPATLLQLAAGPAGWASLAMRTIGTAIAQQVIQQLGQKLGLPSSVINMAQQAFSAASGTGDIAQQTVRQAVSSVAQQLNLSPQQEGQLQRSADQATASMNKILEQFMKKLSNGGKEEAQGERSGSVLMRIAQALGELMDDKMQQLATKADELGRLGTDKSLTINGKDAGAAKGTFNAEGQGKFGKLSAEVQALGQELSYLSQAISQTIKSIGEAASTVARK